jgi:hypothetical protein
MLPSQEKMVIKLSKLQRDFLILHVDGLLRPFSDEPTETRTREALIEKELIEYDPKARSRLGIPQGTVRTDPLGREAICMVLSWEIEDVIHEMMAMNNALALATTDEQAALFKAMRDSAKYWLRHQPPDNRNGRKLVL